MENLENNNLEAMDMAAPLGSIQGKPITFDDIIVHLKVMESMAKSSLKYLDKVYTQTFKIDKETLEKIANIETSIHLLESQILETISKDKDCQDKYNGYLNLHRNFMQEVLFTDKDNAIVGDADALNTILEQIPAVADLVQQRKEKFEEIIKLDGIGLKNKTNITFRYKRIFLQRKKYFCTNICTTLTETERFERTLSNIDDLNELLNNQDDFAKYTFDALCKPVLANETMLTGRTPRRNPADLITTPDRTQRIQEQILVRTNTIGRRTIEIQNLIGELNTTTKNNTSATNDNAERVRQLTDDIAQLRGIVEAERGALESLKRIEQLVTPASKKEKEKERREKLKEQLGEHLAFEVSAVAGKMVYLFFAGEFDDKHQDEVLKEILENCVKDGLVLATQFLPSILVPFAGGFVSGLLGSILSGCFEKENPVLEKIKEITKKLGAIETKIDQLKNQISDFQTKMEEMIKELPDEVVTRIESSNMKRDLEKLQLKIETELSNKNDISLGIINNAADVKFETKDLINHSSEVLKLTQEFISYLYGLTSLDVNKYKTIDIPENEEPYIAAKPDSTSFFGWYQRQDKSGRNPFGFTTQYPHIANMHQNLEMNIIKPYEETQKTVNEALEICYAMAMGDDVKDGKDGTRIIAFLTYQRKIIDRQGRMFKKIISNLESKMLGEANTGLFQNFYSLPANFEPTKKTNLSQGSQDETSIADLLKVNSDQFDFTKAFGLQMQEIKGTGKDKVESWHYCTYNYQTKQFEKIKPDEKTNEIGHISRFFIVPSSSGPIYHLYCSNNDCVQELIKAKVSLGLDDTISLSITEDNYQGKAETFRTIPISDPDFENSVDHLFATNGHIVLPAQLETLVQMPLSNFWLHIRRENKLKRDDKNPDIFLLDSYEYRISFRKFKPATKDKEEVSGYAEIFLENLDPEKFKGGVILKFDYATLTCSIGTLDSEGKVDTNVSIEVFSFKPKEGLKTNQLYATNWKLQSKSGYPLNIDNRYLVSYLNKQYESLADTKTKLVAGQALYRNEEIFTDKYKMKYIGDGNMGFYAYNTIGNAYEECLIKSESFTSNVEVLVMQDNGSLVAYDNNGKNVWQRSGDFDYIEMYSNAKVTAYKNNGQGENIFAGLFLHPKPDLRPAEYLKRGEYIGLVMEVGAYNTHKETTLIKLTQEGNLELKRDDKEIHESEKARDSITGLNAHYLKMGLDGTLALYDDKKNVLRKISAGQGNVKLSITTYGNGYGPVVFKGCFVKNEDTPSSPIKEFWLNELQ